MDICRSSSANCRKEARRSLMNFAVLRHRPLFSVFVYRASGASGFFCTSSVTRCDLCAQCGRPAQASSGSGPSATEGVAPDLISRCWKTGRRVESVSHR
jgi:hypothetical protein